MSVCHGYFIRIKSNNPNALGQFAGHITPAGYLMVHVGSKAYLAHRLVATLYDKPLLDGHVVDHIDHDKLHNMPDNLRVVTPAVNSKNTRKSLNASSKYKGVSWSKRDKRWVAMLWLDGKSFGFGSFKSEEEAARRVYQVCLADDNLDKLNFDENLNIIQDFSEITCSSKQLKFELQRDLRQKNLPFACAITGQTKDLHIHHIKNFVQNHVQNPDLFYDLNNVIILTSDLHRKYHKFAKKDVTKENFILWLKTLDS